MTLERFKLKCGLIPSAALQDAAALFGAPCKIPAATDF